ncbi:YfcC family protein [Marivirga salinae]|uniref:YfcC family protein n=1 Tax=Marivirga salinarum TaxID=3059078 RepID=A0AA51NBC6_9BACT|nr:YfcC family protein [Marivirga sp. BDSF4-3]WMN12013.1 YfcC family protein [Marivirga sp. BDSF4-3]
MKFPAAQSILLIIAALVTILTWLIPAGSYNSLSYESTTDQFSIQNQDSSYNLPATQASLEQLNIKIPLEKFTSGAIYKPISIPNTYQQLPSQPQGVIEFLSAPIKGIIEAADIIFLVLIIGGMIGIMNVTGAFNAGMSWLSKALKGREFLLIIFTTLLISLGGSTFGLAEETLAFYPILIPIFIAAGYDSMVGLASIFLGSAIGVMCSTVNPFATIIASDAAGISWTSGLEGRVIIYVVCMAVTIAYILIYARKVKRNPEKSLVDASSTKSLTYINEASKGNDIPLTLRLRAILMIFTACFVIMIMGVSQWDWWFVEMTTVFFAGSIVIGFIAKMKESAFINSFIQGAGDLLGVAFIIGLARGITILMTDGLISDSILFYASEFTTGMNKGVFVNVLFFIYQGLTFFIPSSSGMAVLTMPILSPLADNVNIGREVIVNAYQLGNGLFNSISPTGLVLASLGLVKIGYEKYLKFMLPLYAILALIGMVFLTILSY